MTDFNCPECCCTSPDPVVVIDEKKVANNKELLENYKRNLEAYEEKIKRHEIECAWHKSLPKKVQEELRSAYLEPKLPEYFCRPSPFIPLPTSKIVCPVCGNAHYFYGLTKEE